ncbi:hypothetical protein OIO90_003306 [Microbotryomycetes sp. JL221]|nr:hypothetical protein OIO90_003306 [Microbotryomycetes sp. JL221]
MASDGSQPLQRAAAIASLRRAASAREAPTTSRNRSTSSPSTPHHLSPPSISPTLQIDPQGDVSQDVSLFQQEASSSSLERTASLLARSMAMAKLTGQAPPNRFTNSSSSSSRPGTSSSHPFTFNEPLPSLDLLRERAQARVKAAEELGLAPPPLKRNHTVTGIGGAARILGENDSDREINYRFEQDSSPSSELRPPKTAPAETNTNVGLGVFGSSFDEMSLGSFHSTTHRRQDDVDHNKQQQLESEPSYGRTQARVNLIRKLSARRLAPGSTKDESAQADTTTASSDSPDQQYRRLRAVGGQAGKSRPRSGSVGSLDWRAGAADEAVPEVPKVPEQHLSSSNSVPLIKSNLSPSASSRYLSTMTTTTAANADQSQNSPTNRNFSHSPAMTDATPRTIQNWDITPRATTQNKFDTAPSLDLSPKTESRFHATATSAKPLVVDSPAISPVRRGSQPLSSSVVGRYGPTTDGLLPNHAGVSAIATSSLGLKDAARRRPLPSFGIRAVEDDGSTDLNSDIRRRGSSASSSVAFLDARRRGSDGDHRMFGSIAGSGLRSAGGSFDSGSNLRLVDYLRRSGSGSSSMLLSRGSMSGGEDGSTSSRKGSGKSDMEEIATNSTLSSSGGGLGTHSRSARDVISRDVSTLEQRYLDTVERKREMGLKRSRDGPFPPAQQGYKFPSPTEGTSPWKDEQAASSERQSSQSTSIHERRQRRSPFLSSYAPIPVPDGTPASPIIAVEPISPTSELPPLPSIVAQAGRSAPAGPEDGDNIRRGNLSASSPGKTMSLATVDGSLPNLAATSPRLTTTRASGSPDSEHSWSSQMQRDRSGGSSVDLTTFASERHQQASTKEELPSNRILSHLDQLLGQAENDVTTSQNENFVSHDVNHQGNSLFDQPPRKLLLHTPVLQVVNANTVKDRYLFLFSDLLLIAKPIILDGANGEPIRPTLDSSFIVKSVVELDHLKVMAAEDPNSAAAEKKRRRGKEKPSGLTTFIDRFASDPRKAIASLIQRGGIANDAVSIANCIFTNPELNRDQVGSYLSAPDNRLILSAFVERFKIAGVRIDDALRVFLITLRLPFVTQVAEYVSSVFAMTWTESNGSSGFDPALTTNLVLAIMRLSDALHASADDALFAEPNPNLSVEEFVARVREFDTRMVVPEDLLTSIYASVRRDRIEQGSDNSIFSMTPDIECDISLTPTSLTYRSPSQPITITIPEPDSKFSIKLHGNDLKFDPPILSFAKSRTQSFKVTGTSFGARHMVFVRKGANAPRYQGLPSYKVFSVERAFMQHTFQVSFTNHLDVKRKYMFSTLDAQLRTQWLQAIRQHTSLCLQKPRPATAALEAGEAVAVQVLRDSLIQPDEQPTSLLTSLAAPSPRPNTAAPRFATTSSGLQVGSQTNLPRSRHGTPTRLGAGALTRSQSVSKIYAKEYRYEADLTVDGNHNNSSLAAQKASKSASAAATRRGSRDEAIATSNLLSSVWSKRGHEIVVTTEQNSLLPVVLSFLGAGLPAAPHPMSVQGSAFQLPPVVTNEGSDRSSSTLLMHRQAV